MSNKRFRSFSCVFYSFVTDYEELLTEFFNKNSIVHISYILHDKDIDNSGNLKQPHYHFNVRYKNPVTYERAYSDIKSFVEGNLFCEVCRDLSLAYSYLTHKNDKDKYQYSDDDITKIGDYIPQTFINDNDEFLFDLFSLHPLDMARKYGRDFIKNYSSYTKFKSEFDEIFVEYVEN